MSFSLSARLWLSLLACTSAVTAAGYVFRERIVFVDRCLGNGNALSGCWCTFNALPELPKSYRSLAVSWAHDNSVTYAANIMALAAWEVARASKGPLKLLTNSRDRRRTARAWLVTSAEGLGWAAAKQAAPVAAAKVAPWVVAAPIVYQIGSNLTRARGVMGRHCGGTIDTFMVRVDRARQELEQASRRVTAASLDAILEGIEGLPDVIATAGGWTWRRLKSVFNY